MGSFVSKDKDVEDEGKSLVLKNRTCWNLSAVSSREINACAYGSVFEVVYGT